MTPEGPISTVTDWPEVALADVTSKVGSGSTPRGGAATYLDRRIGYALVRSQNVFDWSFGSVTLKPPRSTVPPPHPICVPGDCDRTTPASSASISLRIAGIRRRGAWRSV